MNINRKNQLRYKKNVIPKSQRFNPSTSKLTAQYPLQYIQIDQTKLDIIIVDKETRKPIGCPWLMIGTDVYSGVLWGFNLSFNEPDAASLKMTMYNGIWNKVELCQKHGIDPIKWNMHGIPENIIVDNGKVFNSSDFINACESFGINIVDKSKFAPMYGSLIERYFRKLNSLFFRRFSTKKTAVLTLDDVERAFCRYVTEIYLDTIQVKIKTTPRRKWLEGLKVKQPKNVVLKSDLLLLLPTGTFRKVLRSGVRFNDIEYWDVRLIELIHKDVIIRYNPMSLSVIYVEDPRTNKYFAVKAKQSYKDIANLSINELHALKKSIRLTGKVDYIDFRGI